MRYLVLLLLLGCATPEQRAERMLTKYGPMCDRIGFQRDSDAWRNCVIGQAQADDSNAIAGYAATQMNRIRTCVPVGNTITCN